MRRSSRLLRYLSILDEVSLDEEEIEGQLVRKEGSELLLGKYSPQEIIEALERFKILEDVGKKGYSKIAVELDFSDPFHQKVFLKGDDVKIGEIILNTFTYKVKKRHIIEAGLNQPFKSLVIEWLTLENPLCSFDESQKRLPGQRYPGLGIGRKIIKVLRAMAEDLKLDCILAFPEFYHNAVLYREFFRFLSPIMEGRFRAMIRDMGNFDLCEVSYAFTGGCIIEKTGERRKRISWRAEEMVYPLSETMVNYFTGKKYIEIMETNEKNYSYGVDWKSYERKKENLKKEI